MNKLFSTIMSVCLACNVQATDLFKTSQDIALRAPSVPLITSDTYLAIWSPYNELNEGNTEHWTAATHPLLGALRVDGKVYRFMGKDKLNLETILPMTNTERWEAKFTMSQPAANWIQPQFDDSGWTKGKAAFGTKDMKRIGTEWNTEDIWVRRSFNLDQDLTNDIIYLRYSHDDVFELYLNGEKLVATDYSWNDDVTIELSASAKAKLRKGTNIIAAHCHNTTGGAYNTSLSVGGSGKIVQPRFARNGMAEFNGITDGIDRFVGSLQIIIYCDTSRFTDRKFGSSCQRCLRAHADR